MWSLKVIAHKVIYTEWQSWPWHLTQWPKINRVPPLIIHNLHVKFESDWAKTAVCIVSKSSLYTECQSWPWTLTLWHKINRVPSLIIHNLHVKFNLKLIKQKLHLYCVQKVFYTECQSWPWPLTLWPKINRVPSLIIHNLHVKFENDWAKTAVCIVSTRSYTQSAKVDFDLWPHDSKSIGFLLSSSTTYMWSLKVIGQKLHLYCVHKFLYTECQSWPWPLTLWPKINRVPPLINHNLHVKFEIDWAKTVVAIVSTR